MVTNNAPKTERIHDAIDLKVAELKKIVTDSSVVCNAQQLHDTEKRIAALTDVIAGYVTEAVVARSVENEDLKTQSKVLVKQSPVRMKNRGVRPVKICPYRGESFTIEAVYYTKAGQSMKKADKKGGFIRS